MLVQLLGSIIFCIQLSMFDFCRPNRKANIHAPWIIIDYAPWTYIVSTFPLWMLHLRMYNQAGTQVCSHQAQIIILVTAILLQDKCWHKLIFLFQSKDTQQRKETAATG
jgi:hypothetical protein